MSGNDGQSGEGVSFEERLEAARKRRGMDAPPAGAGKTAVETSALGVGMRVGVEMVAALAVAVAIGWYLDRWLHTSPAFLAVFVLLGGAAGVANVWRLMAPKRPRP